MKVSCISLILFHYMFLISKDATMNSKRCFIFAMPILLVAAAVVFGANRGIIRNTADLSHNSGKLGIFRALVIGIDDYKDPAIPDLQTAVNDAKAIGVGLDHGTDGAGHRVQDWRRDRCLSMCDRG